VRIPISMRTVTTLEHSAPSTATSCTTSSQLALAKWMFRRKLDSGDRLPDLIPDLTAIVRGLQLTGQIATITE
jgi:hypothetical protein